MLTRLGVPVLILCTLLLVATGAAAQSFAPQRIPGATGQYWQPAPGVVVQPGWHPYMTAPGASNPAMSFPSSSQWGTMAQQYGLSAAQVQQMQQMMQQYQQQYQQYQQSQPPGH